MIQGSDENAMPATQGEAIVSHVVPYSMGELFEGSHGLACAICGCRGSMLWLTIEEKDSLPVGDARNYVCEHKLGKPLCRSHQPPLELVVYRDCG